MRNLNDYKSQKRTWDLKSLIFYMNQSTKLFVFHMDNSKTIKSEENTIMTRTQIEMKEETLSIIKDKKSKTRNQIDMEEEKTGFEARVIIEEEKLTNETQNQPEVPKSNSQLNLDSSSESPKSPKNANKKKVTRRRNYANGEDAKKMKEAIKFFEENLGTNINEIARKFGVDRKSLRHRIDGELNESSQVGPKGALTKAEEEILVKHLIDMAALGFGYNAFQVTYLVRSYLKKDLELSDYWVYKFLERHPEISKRRAQAMEKQRLGALDIGTVKNYFKTLEVAFQKCADLSDGIPLTAGRVFAADEVGFSNKNSQGYVLAKTGTKNPFVVTSNISNHIIIMALVLLMDGMALNIFY